MGIDKSWISLDRLSNAYDKGVEAFLEFAQSNNPNSNVIACPCKKCINLCHHSIVDVRYHLFAHGFNENYKVWSFHGEKLPNNSRPPEFDDNYTSDYHYTKEMLDDAFAYVDNEPESLKSLLEECDKPLYVGSKYNALSGLLKFQHLKGQYGSSDASFDALLGALKDVLPLDSTIHSSIYEAKKLLKGVGLQYEKIHACENDWPYQPGNNIDVYLKPLIEDLKLLWETCVKTFDAYKKEYFNLRAVLLWTINDFPAYGNLSGCVTKGYHACPICSENTSSIWLPKSRKVCFLGHRNFLPLRHPFRRRKKDFNNQQERDVMKHPLSGEEIYDYLEGFENKWGKKKKSKKETSKKKTSKKSKKSSKKKTPKEKTSKKEKESIDERTKLWHKKSICFNLNIGRSCLFVIS
ncbi:uncharacterized protein LOC143561837 [Bidens hawaiensis]|uniref:uncharacterized protein LOC143561837 n=1 Tax=Bidens hawaiensis TaxID=980011 RepID=UPI00404B0192